MFYTKEELILLSDEQLIEICKTTGIQYSEHDPRDILIGMILRYNVYTYQELIKTDPVILLKLTDKYVYEEKTETFFKIHPKMGNNRLQEVDKEQVIESIIEKQLKQHPKLCSTETITFKRYQTDSNLFNEFLRETGGFPNDLQLYKHVNNDNMETLVCIKMFDDMMQIEKNGRTIGKTNTFIEELMGMRKTML